MKTIITDGNEACARASYMYSEVAGIYPITPSSPMPEFIDICSSKNKKNLLNSNVKVVEMQSEAGAIAMVHGSLQAGLLTSTYTSSQGLLLMIPNMYKIAGEMLPCTMHVAARTIATHALSIFGDHQDVYATRDTGFCMLSSSSVEEAYYMAVIAHQASLKSSLPFMHFFDGFRTSHEINKISVLDDNDLTIDKEDLSNFRKRALNINNPVTRGTNQNSDIYFQQVEARNIYYNKVADNVIECMDNINKIAGTDYKPFNYYGSKNAKKVIIAMGSVCETIKEVIDYLNDDLGLVTVHLYRPFSTKHLLSVIPKTVTKIAVLDRAKTNGAREPLYLDVVNAFKDSDITIVGGRYGLSSKDTTPGMIKAIYDSLDDPKDNFTIGINDDVTNSSLPYKTLNTFKGEEFIIYGYGSDGMVSASKSIIELVGNHTNKYVQGYFDYDSKKSGGVTASHLRFSNNKIRSTYLVQNPSLVVISKDSYLYQFDMFNNIKENGTVIINTTKTNKEILKDLNPYKSILNNKNITVYTINAFEIARKHGLGNKISMIMEKAILSLTNLIDENIVTSYMEEFIKNKFSKKGEDIVNFNLESIKEVENYLNKLILDKEEGDLPYSLNNVYEYISHRKGNLLKVSDFNNPDGTFKHTIPNNRGISDITPKWLSEKCIQCGRCSFVCPHGVIRTFMLDSDEYSNAPLSIKEKCIKAKGYDGYFVIGISTKNCTGCGLCISTCPSDALTFEKLAINDEFDYLVDNIKEKDIFPKNTIKGSQLVNPKFAFHGACGGCGETAYIKLLTQLFKDNLMIANATGCSSIYGGSIPDLPYSIPWVNSLFEDNAEFGYGINIAYNKGKEKVYEYMKENNDDIFRKYLEDPNDYKIAKEVYDSADYNKHPYLKDLKNYIISPNLWIIGGDGWAYDIGFSGIDHVLSSGDDVNILVLDSQVYSNTGGQASKATPKGAVAKFASSGKKSDKKDLARIAMCYPNTFVAQVNIGANMMQVIKAFEEASNHKGPSIVIAYSTCIAHGIKGGMTNSLSISNMATKCGYFPIFRYNGTFTLDGKDPDFDLYEEFLQSQNRYNNLKDKDLLIENKKEAIERFNYYKNLK